MIFKTSTKTLVAVLNHNLPDYTDHVFEILKEYKDKTYDIVIIDNGSAADKQSKHTTHKIDKNCYFGGGINYAFKLVLKNKKYDSLLFLNNDIVFHGNRFVRGLREALLNEDHAIVSPVVLQPGRKQTFWPMMHNWGARDIRTVRWVDFQAPMISRRLIEKIDQFPEDLLYGYGQSLLAGIVCEDEGWTIGVCDFISIIHYGSLTLRSGVAGISLPEYKKKAIEGMESYFKITGQIEKYHSLRDYARRYVYSS